MIAWLLAVLLTISSPATATSPAQRGPVTIPTPPTTPAPPVADTWAEDGCTRTRIGPTVVAATHCGRSTNDDIGAWSTNGDIAWTGPPVDWADPAAIPYGATLWAVGYPATAHGNPVAYTLAALDPRTVTLNGAQQRVLMALGDGTPCTGGASGMIAWVTIDNEAWPVGPLSVYATNPATTSLPAGQYVCGFAI